MIRSRVIFEELVALWIELKPLRFKPEPPQEDKPKYKRIGITPEQAKLFPNHQCSVCGWVGPCDRHRVISGRDGGEYIEANVQILCPNCHKLKHLGRL